MNIKEASVIIGDDRGTWVAWVEAAGVLAQSRESAFNDLLKCLKRKGLPAETAACALYNRTKRPRADDSLHSVVLDFEDWSRYLRETGFI